MPFYVQNSLYYPTYTVENATCEEASWNIAWYTEHFSLWRGYHWSTFSTVHYILRLKNVNLTRLHRSFLTYSTPYILYFLITGYFSKYLDFTDFQGHCNFLPNIFCGKHTFVNIVGMLRSEKSIKGNRLSGKGKKVHVSHNFAWNGDGPPTLWHSGRIH